ncbi:ligand-gated channel protein [Idiomarina xiamenensis]|uniref:Enterobactin receptor protein n=1 Tax=Idiomarina xiamenensis 10-D-4 TaxID=740709 RepID=K2JHQ6_9GAMM|nr:ligand-gated channel protein [Idiomarina xiamenensis]EKE82916.1 enterobactin receptor protein [Idiomarina xiamenensis 10-D-4]
MDKQTRTVRTKLASAVAALLATASSPAVYAAAADMAQDMEVIVVTASGFEQQLKDAPASITVIDQEALSARFYQDLTDAMADVPGAIVTGGGDRQDISLRGMSSQYTLILIDGQRQSSRETRPNSDGPGVESGWTPPLAAIDRIEIIRGPMSSLYGSDAIGGVINIITKKTPEQWRGQVRVDATLHQRDESGDRYQANFYTAGTLIPDTLGLQLYGQWTQRQEDDIYEGFRGRQADNVKAKLAWTPSHQHEFMFEAGQAVQRLDSTLGKTVEPLAEGESCGRSCPATAYTEYDSKSFSIAHNGLWDIGSSRSYLKYDEFDNKSRLMTIKNTDFQTLWSLPLGLSHSASVGAAYLKEELQDQTSNRISDLQNISNDQWSLFAEDEWKMNAAFALTLGLRYDRDEQFSGHFSPRLYGVYTLSGDTVIKGGISSGYRAPSLRQTEPQWGQVSRGGNIYGNPDLAPEKSLNYELGWYTNWTADFSTSASIFYNEFDDKISRVQCPATQCTDGPNEFGSDPTTYINVDEAITQGIELTFNAQLNDQLSWSGNYTFTDSEQKTGQYQGEPLNQLPKHLLQTNLNWQISDAWQSWVRLHFRGEESQPTTGPSSGSLVAPSYTLADLGVNYRINNDWKLGVGIYNLFDKDITEQAYGYVEDGRRLWLSLAWDF